MRRVILIVALAVLLAMPVAADHHEGGTAYGKTLAANLERVSGQLMQLAEAIPDEVFAWRPAEGVRSTSEVLMHVVSSNMLILPAIGAAPAEGLVIPENPFALARDWEANVTAKADVMAKLEESIAYAKHAIRTFPEEAMGKEFPMFGPGTTNRDALLVVLSHSHEHLGQLIAYARSNGVVPPWSQPMPESP